MVLHQCNLCTDLMMHAWLLLKFRNTAVLYYTHCLSSTDEPYCPGIRRGFFPPLSKFDPPYPIAPDGYLPNSSILQQLRKSEEDRLLAESWSPPTLSDKQRQLMEETREVGSIF